MDVSDAKRHQMSRTGGAETFLLFALLLLSLGIGCTPGHIRKRPNRDSTSDNIQPHSPADSFVGFAAGTNRYPIPSLALQQQSTPIGNAGTGLETNPTTSIIPVVAWQPPTSSFESALLFPAVSNEFQFEATGPSPAATADDETAHSDTLSQNIASIDNPTLVPELTEAVDIPLAISTLPNGNVSATGPLVTVSVRDTPVHAVLNMLAQQQGLSIVSPADLQTSITLSLQPMPLEQALNAIVTICGCTWNRMHGVIYVTPVSQASALNYRAQGRMIQVFDLDYLTATDAEQVVTGLLSPVGKVFTRQSDPKNKRKAVEQLVVEDLPTYVERIAGYIAEVDRAPQQVMVEVRLLQVKLEKDDRHGINFDAIAQLSGTELSFETQTLAAANPSPVFTIDGGDFDGFLDCLVTTNDAKTLAAPKLLMVNEQESKIQIGRRLGYFVTTTTQTSTLQDVQFLEVGVVLTVTPQITRDGHILMQVHPKVSSGEINPTTTLPEEETTEVDTSVMVLNEHGVIIGGLIQEVDNERQSKLPLLGDLWLVGRLFQRRTVERERVEVVVALLPRIVNVDAECLTEREIYDLQRVDAPILTPTLESAPRPEPKLHDSLENPSRLLRR